MPAMDSTASRALGTFRIWHLGLLVLFVAIAIANIQDQRRHEPALIALASIGFVVYGALCWAGWRLVSRYEGRLGRLPALTLYLAGISALFLLSTVIYLVLEQLYLG